jgi:hypothetical protein
MNKRALHRRAGFTFMAAALVAAGCGKKDDEPSPEPTAASEDPAAAEPTKPEPKAEPAAHPAVVADSPLATYGLAGIADKLQGAWVLGGSSLGRTAAWKVDGASLTEWEGGDTDRALSLEILAPCYLRSKDEAAGSSVYKTFAFDGDTLYAGLGSAGVLTDDGAVACVGGGIYELAGGTCTAWKERFGRWEKSESTCSLEDGAFKVDGRELTVQGQALVDQQMSKNVAEKHGDFEAAKAAAKER